jgi:hypothetical protein
MKDPETARDGVGLGPALMLWSLIDWDSGDL